MSSPPWIASPAGFAPRLALYYAGYFSALGVQMPFFPIWLAAKGLEPRTIGITLALPMFIRVLAVPLMTRAADGRDALRTAIIVGTVATALGYGLTGCMEGAVGIMAVYGLFALVYTPTMPMVDAYALRGLVQYGGSYGPVRMWGSATFIGGNIVAGLLLTVMAPQHLIWLIAGGYALTAVISLGLAPLTPVMPHPGAALGAIVLLRNRMFLTAILAASLIQASHAMLYGFSSIAWEAAGIDSTSIGVLAALAVIAEIVLFAVSGRLPAWLSPTMMLMLGAAGAVVRWGAMALDPPILFLPALQCLHALSFAASHLGAIAFLNRVAPPGLAATAQGNYAIVAGLVMAAATAASGQLYAAFGIRGYAAMAVIAAAGGLLALDAHRRWQAAEA
jgi:PPP family 3-phenylpropionic acid transporter